MGEWREPRRSYQLEEAISAGGVLLEATGDTSPAPLAHQPPRGKKRVGRQGARAPRRRHARKQSMGLLDSPERDGTAAEPRTPSSTTDPWCRQLISSRRQPATIMAKRLAIAYDLTQRSPHLETPMATSASNDMKSIAYQVARKLLELNPSGSSRPPTPDMHQLQRQVRACETSLRTDGI